MSTIESIGSFAGWMESAARRARQVREQEENRRRKGPSESEQHLLDIIAQGAAQLPTVTAEAFAAKPKPPQQVETQPESPNSMLAAFAQFSHSETGDSEPIK